VGSFHSRFPLAWFVLLAWLSRCLGYTLAVPEKVARGLSCEREAFVPRMGKGR
jgi:hypothetical protein